LLKIRKLGRATFFLFPVEFMRHAELLRSSTWRRILKYSALIGVFAGQPAPAQHQHESSEFVAFVAAEGLAGHGQPHPREDDPWIDVDVVFALTHQQFRMFGEYFITPGEHDLERFQVGYEVVPDTVVWLGRFHQPGSAWDTEHHHGRYLQTAITRPSIENWEDEDGLIPQHITGVLVESRRQFGAKAGVQFSAGAGAAPVIEPEHNEPINLVGNNPGRHGVSLTGRLAYLPDYVETSSTGFLFGHDQLFASREAASRVIRSNHVVLTIYGAYLDWSLGEWRIIGTGYYVNVELDRPSPDGSFISGYVQAERQFPYQLTAFARVEDSARMQRLRYVTQLDQDTKDIDITIRRQTGGLRWDFARRQALTVEVGHEASLSQHGNEVRLQWSAAIP
jgi:hypothetical protein